MDCRSTIATGTGIPLGIYEILGKGLYVLQMCDRQMNAKNVLQTGKTTNRLIKD